MKNSAVSPYNTIPEVLQPFRRPQQVILYDSTLRDGEQMPGISFTPEQKLQIARKLDAIGIPEIEAGFPAVSEEECKTVKKISQEELSAKILVLSRLTQSDIDAARKADADVVLLFIATSPLHLQHKLHCTQEDIKTRAEQAICYAKDHGISPSFSSEDSTRTPLSFLKELMQLACDCGATRIGLTDTVGCATPQAIQYLFSEIQQQVSVPMSAHLHNDFGLGVINAISALSAGATHCCVTVNGWGERAGNVPLEQLVMALQVLYDYDVGIDTTQLSSLSQMISQFTGISIPKNQPFVGSQIFSHESGIHVAAVLENPDTYEPITPERVGNTRHLVLGKHTGRHLIRHHFQQQGITVDEQTITDVTAFIKHQAEQGVHLTFADLKQYLREEKHR